MRTIEEIETQDLLDLRQAFPVGVDFSISEVQRRMMWGFNRTFRTLLKAVELKQAISDEGPRRFTLM